MVPDPAPDNAPAPEGGRGAVARGWLVTVELLGLSLTLALLGLGAWLALRRSRRAGRPPAPAPQEARPTRPAATAAALVAFRCSGCGKDLKVRAELAGKKGRCPQCRTTQIVPGSALTP
jgi:hypothetical protein